MASIVKRLADLARSPQGRQLAEKAKQAAQDPENRKRLEELRKRVARKR
jgi:ribosomal protein L29